MTITNTNTAAWTEAPAKIKFTDTNTNTAGSTFQIPAPMPSAVTHIPSNAELRQAVEGVKKTLDAIKTHNKEHIGYPSSVRYVLDEAKTLKLSQQTRTSSICVALGWDSKEFCPSQDFEESMRDIVLTMNIDMVAAAERGEKISSTDLLKKINFEVVAKLKLMIESGQIYYDYEHKMWCCHNARFSTSEYLNSFADSENPANIMRLINSSL